MKKLHRDEVDELSDGELWESCDGCKKEFPKGAFVAQVTPARIDSRGEAKVIGEGGMWLCARCCFAEGGLLNHFLELMEEVQFPNVTDPAAREQLRRMVAEHRDEQWEAVVFDPRGPF